MKSLRGSGLAAAALAAALVVPTLARAPAAHAQGVPPGSNDPRLLDELAKDLVRFQEAVKGYRTATNVVIRRAYYEKIQAIKGKYEPLIALNEKNERDRRMDAIAMFEAFLRKYPSDRRWTPDAMFRLADRVTDYVWVRPYFGGGAMMHRQNYGAGVSDTTLGYQAFGGGEFTFASVPRFALSADAGYRWSRNASPGFDFGGVAFSVAGHWYFR